MSMPSTLILGADSRTLPIASPPSFGTQLSAPAAEHSSLSLPVMDDAALPTPYELQRAIPLTAGASRQIAVQRAQVREIASGRDPRLLVVVGPCSVHDPDEALTYAERLAALAPRLSDELLVVMRVYVEKPRSTLGWKGLLNDPDLDGRCDLVKGLQVSRRLMRRVAELGLPVASELLDPNLAPYLVDMVSWAAIGARTASSQPHRELVSGLPLPVGFKNGVDGSLDVALGAMQSSERPHCRVGIGSNGQLRLERTRGNPDVHLTLRGGADTTNYDTESVHAAAYAAEARGLNPHMMIDCSHGNSQKDHRNQPLVLEDVAEQVAGGCSKICGVMLESQLVAGRQDLAADGRGLTYGQSVTDACIDWDTTVQLLTRLASAAATRRDSVLASAGSSSGSGCPACSRR